MSKHYKNNGGGGTAPKSGDHYTPLCRRSGYMKTMESCASKTRSRHKGTEKHNRYESAMVDDTANVHGWDPE